MNCCVTGFNKKRSEGPFVLFLDKNECLSGHHGCSHGCVNLIGHYECSCPSGFTLDQNGLTCKGMHSKYLHAS